MFVFKFHELDKQQNITIVWNLKLTNKIIILLMNLRFELFFVVALFV